MLQYEIISIHLILPTDQYALAHKQFRFNLLLFLYAHCDLIDSNKGGVNNTEKDLFLIFFYTYNVVHD